MENCCPICQKPLKIDSETYFNISCRSRSDHYYVVNTSKSGKKIELRFRINLLCAIVSYAEGITKIWSAKEYYNSSITVTAAVINEVIQIDFSDIPRLKEKLEKYIIFS